MDEWREISFFTERIPIRKGMRVHNEGTIILKIPENFWRFYNLNRKHHIVSINGNNLLVTVSGDIIKEKNYPS